MPDIVSPPEMIERNEEQYLPMLVRCSPTLVTSCRPSRVTQKHHTVEPARIADVEVALRGDSAICVSEISSGADDLGMYAP